MVTMKQIDRAREELLGQRILASRHDFATLLAQNQARVREAEEKVEALLRQWWAQGCREVAPQSTYDQLKRDFDTAMDVTEVAFKQRDGAFDERDAARIAARDWQAKYDALNRHREDQEALIESLKKDREVAEREIARLKHEAEIRRNSVADARLVIGAMADESLVEAVRRLKDSTVYKGDFEQMKKRAERAEFAEKELDEVNKKIYADRDRLARALGGEEALPLLHEVRKLAADYAEGLRKIGAEDINTPPSKSWVMEQIAEAIHNLAVKGIVPPRK